MLLCGSRCVAAGGSNGSCAPAPMEVRPSRLKQSTLHAERCARLSNQSNHPCCAHALCAAA
eukprot:10259325-Alexandrium_andersonii.AAC.1